MHYCLNGSLASQTRRQYTAVQVRLIVVVTILTWQLCATAGCNEFHRPLTIAPESELKASRQSIFLGMATVNVPDGWTVSSFYRANSQHGGSAELDRLDGRQRAGTLWFIAQKGPPDWLEYKETKVVDTLKHKNVSYWIKPSRKPSGDDTPGSYGLSAYITTEDAHWEMLVGFTRPVEPDVQLAIKYIDALELNPITKDKSVSDKPNQK